ncbi:MAG: histidine--tRNA ligase, partial [Armatimonadetes bacterium]|nr:histidine--tRNA ligase [Armatimonadota bacterium]
YDVNPLRVLDCKNEQCRSALKNAPVMLEWLCEECAEHFRGVREHLDILGIPYEVEPHIVRGLDYYTKTAFEFVSAGLGSQDAIGGGGRYDGLVEQCGGPPTPGVGFGIGIERVLLVRQALGLSQQERPREGALVVALAEGQWSPAYTLTARLREAGVPADIDYRQRSLRAQLRFADSAGFRWAIIIGEDELAAGRATVRDMETGDQHAVALDELAAWLAERA